MSGHEPQVEGKIALVTGRSAGIALGIAINFAREDARVIITDQRQAELGKAVAAIGRNCSPPMPGSTKPACPARSTRSTSKTFNTNESRRSCLRKATLPTPRSRGVNHRRSAPDRWRRAIALGTGRERQLPVS